MYKTLDVIRQELAAREDSKLIQQQEEVEALLTIWQDKITGYQNDVNGLDFRNCIRPAMAINVAINYWTGALTNPSQALADLSGVITRLQTFPNAQIQITATFDHSNGAAYFDNPTDYMGKGYSARQRAERSIPTTIQARRDYLAIKAINVRNLLLSQPGITPSQVVANTTPGDVGPHMGGGPPFGNQINIVWLRNQ